MFNKNPENIKVCVRIRPELGHENNAQFHEIAKAVGEQTIVFDPPNNDKGQLKTIFTSQRNKDLKFAFDHVFGPETSQLDIYRSTTAPTLDNVLDGYNCCVFAYGATGAGKTYTMLGNKENPGVILRTVLMLYQKIEALSDDFTFDISISYLEIYNEKLKDLLNPGGKVDLNEDAEGVVSLRGASTHTPKTADDLMTLLYKGNSERTQTSTLANAESSRSHAIFQIYLRRRPKVSGTFVQWKHSKFSLIDLAGSERGTVTNNSKGKREGANINKSLLALGNVINALADRKKNPKAFIPYRGSKLTRLLKDSLGGSCQTIMIANVSPSSSSYEDTYNTLKYANRAKNIKVKMVENSVEVHSHMKDYQKLISDLKEQNSDLRKKLSDKLDTGRKLKEKKEFNAAHHMFDEKCREVFRERAQIKRHIISYEAEQYTISSNLKQKMLSYKLLSSRDSDTNLVTSLLEEISHLNEETVRVEKEITQLKDQLEGNYTRANNIQVEIHTYIQVNGSKIEKSEQEMLVLLWEYHLTKVQSYFAEHSVQALQQSALASQRHLHHMNSVTERLFATLTGIVDNKENMELASIQDKIAAEIQAISVELTGIGKKKGNIIWADSEERDHPSSSLFPSPKLTAPDSPVLSFTPGKTMVGSTPRLNKLQQTLHGAEFMTPAPTKPRPGLLPTNTEIQINLREKFNSIKNQCAVPLRRNLAKIVETQENSPISISDYSKSSEIEYKSPIRSSEDEGVLNSTFTLDSPTVPMPTARPTASKFQTKPIPLSRLNNKSPATTHRLMSKSPLTQLSKPTLPPKSPLPKKKLKRLENPGTPAGSSRRGTTLAVPKRNVPRTSAANTQITKHGSSVGKNVASKRTTRLSMIPRPTTSLNPRPANTLSSTAYKSSTGNKAAALSAKPIPTNLRTRRPT